MTTEFNRDVKVIPAWDSGTRERGAHNAELIFLLTGPKGALTFTIYTGWYLDPKKNLRSIYASVDYHGHSPIDQEDSLHCLCQWLGEKPCYSGRLCCGDKLFTTLTSRGTNGLWEEMEALYRSLFDKEPEWLVEPYEHMARAMAER